MKTQSRPFTVTVKRQKRSKSKSIWSDTPNMADMLAQAETDDEPAAPTPEGNGVPQDASAKASGLNAKSNARNDVVKSQERRILADLTPVELPTAEVGSELPKRPRGRPRKAVAASGNVGHSQAPEQAAAEQASDSAFAEPVREPLASRRPRHAPVRPSPSEIMEARAFDEAGENPLASTGLAQIDVACGAPELAGIVAETERPEVETAPRRRTRLSLRRGERWKRHLPRWKR